VVSCDAKSCSSRRDENISCLFPRAQTCCPYPLLRRPLICHSPAAALLSATPFPRTHRRTRLQIVLTRAGILGLRSRLARSGPGGPAQPPQVSRLHRHASCLTCDTSPHCTAAHRASTLEAQWPQINQCGLCVELQTHHCRTLHACGPPRPSRQRQSPFQRCLLCRTRAWAIIGVRTAAAAAESDV